jgi:phosphopantetheinyl transferase (holo-ACP synthase)
MIIEHNVQTGEIIERELNAEELKQITADQIELEAALQAKAAKEAAREAVLTKLGLTAEEAAALLALLTQSEQLRPS